MENCINKLYDTAWIIKTKNNVWCQTTIKSLIMCLHILCYDLKMLSSVQWSFSKRGYRLTGCIPVQENLFRFTSRSEQPSAHAACPNQGLCPLRNLDLFPINLANYRAGPCVYHRDSNLRHWRHTSHINRFFMIRSLFSITASVLLLWRKNKQKKTLHIFYLFFFGLK